ncbi:sigma-70 family RNA polymerase sigma factor [Streptomyces sp. NPDC026665]|uniref:sigma-70 family RNA polymerase sigma factor n=1 Tax=Streptomyces sp. NPDC026665 TaxID=3154798 RepID=UPI0033E62943
MSPRSGRTPKAALVPRQRGTEKAEASTTNRSPEKGMAKEQAEALRAKEVFVPWYLENFDRIARRAIRACSDRQEAESLIHDVCERLFVKLREGKAPFGKLEFTRYAERSVSNAIKSRLRDNGRNRQVPLDENEGLHDPESFVEERQALGRALDELPEKWRKVIELSYYEGMKPAAIAEELSITPQSVSTYKSSGLRRLREHPEVARLIEVID